VTTDATWITHRRLMAGVILPMLLEDGEWQVDLPGWRFFQVDQKGTREA
jgi:hypothetical protein